MANKAISELPQAQNVNNQDLFVLEQSGIAKKLAAETFITEQGIIDALAEALDGHGGIQSVTLSSVSGRIRTYLITFTDQSATTFQVYDGTSIDSIAKTSTAGAVDTYTIYMSDSTTSFFNVTNGSNIASITKTSSSGLVDTYTITLSDGSTTTFDVTNGTASIDPTLSVSGRAADAKATGDAIDDLQSAIDDCEDEIFYTKEKNLEWVIGLMVNVSNFKTKASDKCTKPFTLYKGETVSIKTKGDGSYFFNAITKADSLDVTMANGYRAGTTIQAITNNHLTEYTYTATDEEEYIILSALNDPTTAVAFSNLKVYSKITDLNNDFDILQHESAFSNKNLMFFGDSLTSAARVGLVGFSELLAKKYNLPYKSFVYDSVDSNPSDVPIDYPAVINYAKDGTTNRIRAGRTDSVVERVKRHIDSTTKVDYVLIECCVNDMALANQNKGEIDESFTAVFDTTTTIGALEETLRYLTTLDNNICIGGFIPWIISWGAGEWFNDYIPVFEKWGVPVFDMRKVAGFNMKDCIAHRLRYSLTSDNYQNYDATATYDTDDICVYGGILRKCLADGVTGILPTNATYWTTEPSTTADGTHLNQNGHYVVAGKIQHFIERC